MGIDPKDYAKFVRNTAISSKKKRIVSRKKRAVRKEFCKSCEFELTSLVVRPMYFDGDYCLHCIKKIPKMRDDHEK